jgi:hypothetical protein
MSTSALPGTYGSGISYWQRAFKLVVTLRKGPRMVITNSTWGNESLKMTFNVEWGVHGARPAYVLANITIWNLNPATTQALLGGAGSDTGEVNPVAEPSGTAGIFNVVIQQGDRVELSAGYVAGNPQMGLIFQGYVFQPVWTKVDVVNYSLELRCLLGLLEGAQNTISLAIAAGATQLQIVQQMAANAYTPLPIDQIDSAALSKKTLPRGRTMFGRPDEIIAKIAADNSLFSWFSPHGLNIRSLNGVSQPPSPVAAGVGDAFANVVSPLPEAPAFPGLDVDYTYSPPPPTGRASFAQTPGGLSQTIIGTPQQTEQGVEFTVLLDPRVKVGDVVKLDYSVIWQVLLSAPDPNQRLPLTRLDADGVYVVFHIKHEGDTRGTPWYTHLNCLTSNWSFAT